MCSAKISPEAESGLKRWENSEVPESSKQHALPDLRKPNGSDVSVCRLRNLGKSWKGYVKNLATRRYGAPDLLARADARAGELAAAYDQARIAGLACEASYNGLTKPSG